MEVEIEENKPVQEKQPESVKSQKKKKKKSNKSKKQQQQQQQQPSQVNTNVSSQQIVNLTSQQQAPSIIKTVKSLGDLDDFELVPSSNSNSNKKSSKFNDLDNFDDFKKFENVNCSKQRIVIPNEKFTRVVGKTMSNLRLIEELTGAVLQLEDTKIPPNQDRSILIIGANLDQTKYAFELLETLINDAQADLTNLLPESSQVKPAKPKVKFY